MANLSFIRNDSIKILMIFLVMLTAQCEGSSVLCDGGDTYNTMGDVIYGNDFKQSPGVPPLH